MTYNDEDYEMKYNNNSDAGTTQPSQQAGGAVDYDYEVQTSGGHSPRRKWYYIGGAVLLLAIGAGVGAGLATKGGGGGAPAPSQSQTGTISDPTGTGTTPTTSTTSEVKQILQNFGVHGGGELDKEGSFQQQALQFVERTYVKETHTVERLVQRYAMACIFYATNEVETRYTQVRFQGLGIQPWLSDQGWVQADDECTWLGVVCNDQGFVTELNLARNGLTGTFPEEAKLLKNLIVIDVEENHCFNSGPEGNDWLAEITTLQYLYLRLTPFHSQNGVPTAFNKLTNLKELDVSYTAYRGALDPNLFANLNQLFVLTMGGNGYNSSIPMTLGRLPKLSYFYASNTDIIGDLSFMQGPELWPNLIELWMDNNPKLTGTIPSNLGSYSNIKSLSFTNCDLSGPLPASLGDLVELKKLWLYGNKLSGPVPDITKLQKLEYFQIEDNDLTGIIPDSVGLLAKPFGNLVNLHADCKIGAVEVACASCTCCGPECKSEPLRM